MFIIFLRVIYWKTFIRVFYIVIVLYLSEIYLLIYYLICLFIIFIYLIYYFVYLINYIVYRKEQSKIRGKSREKIGREYDQISQIIKKKCYL